MTTTTTVATADAVTLGCYEVTFLGVDEGDPTSTWRYEVAELECAQDLSFWILAVSECVSFADAFPEPWEWVTEDANTGLSGIKWQTGAGFTSGEFELVVGSEAIAGDATAAVKGPDVIDGVITGPTCPEDHADAGMGADCTNLDIPDGALPPGGECKIWDPDLDAGQQGPPVPCDCAFVEPGTCLVDAEGEVVNCG